MAKSNSPAQDDIIDIEVVPAVIPAGELLAQLGSDPGSQLRLLWDGYYQAIEQQAQILPEYLQLLWVHDNDARLLEPADAMPMAQLDLFFATLAVGNTRAAAARAAGILPAQLRAMKQELARPLPASPQARVAALVRRKRIEEFFVEVARVEAEVEQQYVRPLHRAATRVDNPDLSAAKYLLERRFKDSWAPDKKVVHTGNTPGTTTVNQTNNILNAPRTIVSLTDDQLAQIEAMYRESSTKDSEQKKVGNIPGMLKGPDGGT